MFTEADTAENTLGLLAIKLFEEGVLKKWSTYSTS
jgi:hypothetical protein